MQETAEFPSSAQEEAGAGGNGVNGDGGGLYIEGLGTCLHAVNHPNAAQLTKRSCSYRTRG